MYSSGQTTNANLKSVQTMSLFIRCLILTSLMLGPFVAPVHAQPGDTLTIKLPEPALRTTLKGLLPLRFHPGKPGFTGTLALQSIDRLTIQPGSIFLSGTLTGKDISTQASFAGRTISIKLGQVSMPVHCTLNLRFDRQQNRLFIRPDCTPPDSTPQGSQPLLSLLGSLADREFPVDLAKILTLPRPPAQPRLRLMPTRIESSQGLLTLTLRPETLKSR